VWYSPPVSSSGYYLPTIPNPQGTHLAAPKVSMKQCMFYVCTLASAANPVNNQTAHWVVGSCSDVAKSAILGYAKRNKIYHGGPGGLGDSETRDAIASNVKDLEKFLPDYQRAHRHLWVRIVKLWKKCGRYMEDVQKSAPKTTPTPDSSRLLAAPPRTAEENEKFTRVLEEGSFQGELDQLSRAGGPCRPDSPHRTQSTRSDPFHGVPSKRKMDLTPALSSLRPLKRQK
jgi:hypothetical protein